MLSGTYWTEVITAWPTCLKTKYALLSVDYLVITHILEY